MKQTLIEIDHNMNELLEKLTEEEYTKFIEETPEISEYDRLRFLADEYAGGHAEELFTEEFINRVRELVMAKVMQFSCN